jgi:Flp pilus assembly protein TadD
LPSPHPAGAPVAAPPILSTAVHRSRASIPAVPKFASRNRRDSPPFANLCRCFSDEHGTEPLRAAWGESLIAPGKPAEAVPHCQEALNDLSRHAEACVGWGRALMAAGDFAGAHAKFVRATERDRNNADACLQLAKALESPGCPGEAAAQRREPESARLRDAVPRPSK